jgi:hypothetical protein
MKLLQVTGYRSKARVVCLLSVVYLFCLSSCNQKSSNIPVVGQIDSLAVAMDTTMQLGLESSYEYHKTLAVHQGLVYDVVGFGKISEGDLTILRRGTNNISDTVVKAKRMGRIMNSFIGDLDNDSHEEIYIATQSSGESITSNLMSYEFDREGEPSYLRFESAANEKAFFRGRDSFYINTNQPDKALLYHQFPVYKATDSDCCPSAGMVKFFYYLFNGKLISKGMEAADSTRNIIEVNTK